MVLPDRYEAALQRLISRGELSAEQAEAVRREFATVPVTKSGWLAEVAGYAGGGLMIVGAGTFLSFAWESLNQSLRIGLLVASTALLIAAAFLIAGRAGIRSATGATGRAAGVLLALSAVPASVAAAVPPETNEEIWGFGTGLFVGLIWLAIRSNALGILLTGVMTAGFVITLGDELGMSWLWIGAALLACGVLTGAAALAGALKPRPLGLATGGTLAIIGAQLPLGLDATKVWAYVLTLAVGASCFALYRWDRSIVSVAVGVVAVTIAVPEIVYDITDGGVNPGLILLIGGAVLVGSSLLGFMLRRLGAAATPER